MYVKCEKKNSCYSIVSENNGGGNYQMVIDRIFRTDQEDPCVPQGGLFQTVVLGTGSLPAGWSCLAHVWVLVLYLPVPLPSFSPSPFLSSSLPPLHLGSFLSECSSWFVYVCRGDQEWEVGVVWSHFICSQFWVNTLSWAQPDVSCWSDREVS